MAKKNKKDTPYDGPALIELNLSGTEKYELEAENKLRADVQACKDAAKAAQAEVSKLEGEKKGLDKKAPDFKQAAKDIDAKMKALYGIVKKKCELKHQGCVPSDNASRVLMPKEVADQINSTYHTNIDFGQLSYWEGGAYTKAYVPWWPLVKDGHPTIQPIKSSSGKVLPRLKGDLHGEPSNQSGATIGTGVDLGQSDMGEKFKLMDKFNTGPAALSKEELKQLKEKISPYFNLNGAEACKYVREHPLSISEKEAIFLNKIEFEEATEKTKIAYQRWVKNNEFVNFPSEFNAMTKEQQTSIMSHVYQYGAGSKLLDKLIEAIVTNNPDMIPPQIREYDYLSKYMNATKGTSQ